MPIRTNVKQQKRESAPKAKRELTTSSFRKPGRKAPGTRYGTIEDWREGSNKAVSGRHGQTVRDGR